MNEELLEDLAALAYRPFDFVVWAYPWGEVGTELEHRCGPEGWQAALLQELQRDLLAGEKSPLGILAEAWQAAVRSGHDVGKSAVLSWLIQWAMATREDTRGRVTANTKEQLMRVLWGELGKWHQLFLAKDLFKITATAYVSADPLKVLTWRIDAIPWNEENPEAFAGLHNYGKRILILFDEASGIHNVIWEVIDGVMIEADTEIIWIATGNPTRATGRFRDCFDAQKDLWRTFKVDSRDVPWTNKERIEKAIRLYGEDSDYVKVRYLGEFPDANASQFFPTSLIDLAMTREVTSFHYDALIMGVDVARFGTNESFISYRQGLDARSIPPLRFRGLSTDQLGDIIAAEIMARKPDAVFIDEGGVGGGVVDFVRRLGHHVVGVNFGGRPGAYPEGVKVANKRAEMYVQVLLALSAGLCIPQADELKRAMSAIEYYFEKRTQAIILVSKEDMEEDANMSLDWIDSLVLTYAFPVNVRRRMLLTSRGAKMEYDPYALEQLKEEVA